MNSSPPSSSPTPPRTNSPSTRKKPRCSGLLQGALQLKWVPPLSNPPVPWRFWGSLSTCPSPRALVSLLSSTRAMTSLARRLSLHLPPDSLRMVMAALYRGKVGYGCLVLRPRFESSDPTSAPMAQLQVAVNDLARSIIGTKRSDRLKVEELLPDAGLISVNRLVIYTIATECWRALNQRDVSHGPLNPLGLLLNCPNSIPVRTRAAANGCLPPLQNFMSSHLYGGPTSAGTRPPCSGPPPPCPPPGGPPRCWQRVPLFSKIHPPPPSAMIHFK